MQGRKPTIGRVIPLRPDIGAPAKEAANRERAFKRQAEKTAKKLKPANLREAVGVKWDEFAPLLAHATLDRLKAHFVYGVVEFCKTMVWIDEIDIEIDKQAEKNKISRAQAGLYRPGDGRNGSQIKTNPLLVQRNEAVRQLWHWQTEFGLTPAAEARIKNQSSNPGQSDLFDPQTKAQLDAIKKVSKYVR